MWMLVNPLQLDTWSTSVEVLTRESLKSSKRKLLKREKDLSSTLGYWTSWKLKEKEVSLLISLCGNSKLTNSPSPLLMLQDIEISSRTWSLVLHRLIVLCWWLLHLLVNSKLVSLRMVRLENMLCWLSLWESSRWSSVLTRSMKRLLTMTVEESEKSLLKPALSWRRSDITQRTSHSSQFPDGLVITCWKNVTNSHHGTRVRLCLILWMILLHQRDQQTNHWDFHCRTSTRLVVLELSQSEELKLVSWSQEWTSLSPLSQSALNVNLSKCITKRWLKLFQEITSDSTSRTCQLRKSREVMLPPTVLITQPNRSNLSRLRLSSWTIQDRSTMDTVQSWIAILPILLANSRKSRAKSTEEMVPH